MSDDTRTIVTVLLLIFIYPLGLILMWTTKWPKWLKIVLSLPLIIAILAFLAVTALSINPGRAQQQAQCVAQCQNSPDKNSCTQMCISSIGLSTVSQVVLQSKNDEIFSLINKYRVSKGLKSIGRDDNLCAIAEISAKDSLANGKKAIGFEKLVNLTENEKYVASFDDIQESQVEAAPQDTTEEVASLMSSPTDTATNSKTMTDGCVASSASTSTWMVEFVGATKQ